jgi:hypothetical protein
MKDLKVIVSGNDIVGQTAKDGKDLDKVMQQVAGNQNAFVAHKPDGNVSVVANGRTFETFSKEELRNVIPD